MKRYIKGKYAYSLRSSYDKINCTRWRKGWFWHNMGCDASRSIDIKNRTDLDNAVIEAHQEGQKWLDGMNLRVDKQDTIEKLLEKKLDIAAKLK